ncbi:GPW/gp25 family protein [Desulfonema magnum]|uniref:Gp25-like domain-containing protein n=1 Tax=Desulfonema magnum TaxID=45655 RepID=A0A975BP86_9BACT|nr:GPW/gp25 family protein [Desulfonema magnum]QTA89090.1 Gp25-like domain-containing protein [Desulfonema magnum]
MHIAFPFKINGRGRTAKVETDEHIRQMIEQVLFTSPGERVNRPDFGTGISNLIFASIGDEIIAATKFMVQGALQQHLSDVILVQDIHVESEDAALRVAVQYVAIKSGQQRVAMFERKLPEVSEVS